MSLLSWNSSNPNTVFIVPVKYFQQLQVMQWRLSLWNVFYAWSPGSSGSFVYLNFLITNPWENLQSYLSDSFHSDWKKEPWSNYNHNDCYIHFANGCKSWVLKYLKPGSKWFACKFNVSLLLYTKNVWNFSEDTIVINCNPVHAFCCHATTAHANMLLTVAVETAEVSRTHTPRRKDWE